MRLMRFYTTDGCHLCEQALAIVQPVTNRLGITLEVVDIMDDETLEARYGTQIPVLAREGDAATLSWPFDAADVYRFGVGS